MARFVQRRIAAEGPAGEPLPIDAGDWKGRYPALVEYMTQCAWGEGEARLTSTVLLFVEDGVWKVCIRDRDQSQVAFFAGKTPAEALAAAERSLASGSAEWRAQREYGKKKGK